MQPSFAYEVINYVIGGIARRFSKIYHMLDYRGGGGVEDMIDCCHNFPPQLWQITGNGQLQKNYKDFYKPLGLNTISSVRLRCWQELVMIKMPR